MRASISMGVAATAAAVSLVGGGVAAYYLIRRGVGGSKKKMDPKKVIFITGCDSGFGFSLALHVVESGGTVIAGIYQGPESEARLMRESVGKPGKLFVVPLDVTEEKSVDSAKRKISEILEESSSEGSCLWTVVNNAAVLVFAEAEWQTKIQISRQFAVNAIGVLSVIQACLPLLRRTPGSRIVNVISFCTDCPLPTLSVYTATKAALKSLSVGLRMELSKYEVHVVLFNPGDHPGDTPLCSGQDVFYEEMEDCKEFPEENVKEYFEACRKKFTALFPTPPIVKIEDPGLYRIFDEIISVKRPKPEYINSDWTTKLFFGFLSVLPTSMADRARIALLRLPVYKG